MQRILMSLALLCLNILNVNGAQLPENFGFSGMAQIDQNRYLVVQDLKGHANGARLAIVDVTQGLDFTPITVANWPFEGGQSSDLESACKLPGTANEFLIAESGSWKGKVGRIFHFSLNASKADILHVYPLPVRIGSNEQLTGDNYEGIACAKDGDGFLVMLGERGGSESYDKGRIRFGLISTSMVKINWLRLAKAETSVTAPGKWSTPKTHRHISDLLILNEKELWAVATDDAGDLGPFRSVIYRVGMLTGDPDSPLKQDSVLIPAWEVDGFKVEALSTVLGNQSNAYMSIGTEDESYRGNWRPLFKPVFNE